MTMATLGTDGPVSVRGRELHRAHLSNTPGCVRVATFVRYSSNGVLQRILVVVSVQIEHAVDLSRISHDTHPCGRRPDDALRNDVR